MGAGGNFSTETPCGEIIRGPNYSSEHRCMGENKSRDDKTPEKVTVSSVRR